MTSARKLAAAHAAYYVATGAWSVVGRRSFERVTGPKRDYWLVRLVGALAVATGASLGCAVVTNRRRPEVVALALGAGAAFVAADAYAARSVSKTYLGDAALHALFLPAWVRRWS